VSVNDTPGESAHGGQRVVGVNPNTHEYVWHRGGGGSHSRQTSGHRRHIWIATGLGDAGGGMSSMQFAERDWDAGESGMADEDGVHETEQADQFEYSQ
jgi:hypothetical protein